jgi:Rod binding domain-containing protein
MTDLTGIVPATGLNSDPVTPSPRLVKAAHEFEASMMQQLLKPMMEDHSGLYSESDDQDDDADSDSSLMEYGTEVMANALSERGGLGLSKMILTKLAPVEAAQEKRKPTVHLKT